MKEIKLRNSDKVVLVDDEDFEWLNCRDWILMKVRNLEYAVYNRQSGINTICILMHRVIAETPDELECDHLDNDGLNNQKQNLRNCTHQQNIWNKRPRKDGSSKYKGVSKAKRTGHWVVHIKNPMTKKVEDCGTFSKEENAALRYNEMATKYFGEFAYLNKI